MAKLSMLLASAFVVMFMALPARAVDCNTNTVADADDISLGNSFDCNTNATPDECDVAFGGQPDCNTNGAPDACDLGFGGLPDCDTNGTPDECDIAFGGQADCDTNGEMDACDIGLNGAPDCNTNGTPDDCELGGAIRFSQTNYAAGFSPTWVRVADLNTDGAQDLVVVTVLDIRVLLGHGDGTFDPAVSYNGGGANPTDAAIADMNTDGALDVVVVNYSLDSVQVFYNDGAGAFPSVANFGTPPGSGPFAVTLGDLNTDGKTDVIIACKDSEQILVYQQAGAGFGLTLTINGFVTPEQLVSGDLNTDGHLDFAVSLFNSSEVQVFYGDGMGGFPTSVSASTGSTPIGLVAKDLNGDAIPDLVTANFNGNNVTTLLNDGGGFFAQTDYPVGNFPIGVAVGDVTGDGVPDLAAPSDTANNLAVLPGNGVGGYGTAVIVPVGQFPWGLASARFNGDARDDLVVANANDDNVSVLLPHAGASADCNTNGTFDACELGGHDCNTNGVPDECDVVGLPISQWASYVIGFSSEWSNPVWSAAQTLGAPDTFSYGDFSTAWAPGPRDGTLEYVIVGYSTPVQATGATIRETDGNGMVYQVDVVDTNNLLHTVWTGADPSLPGTPVDFEVTWPRTTYWVKGVKVYTNTDHDLNAWEEIDAIALHGTALLVAADCNTNGTPDECDVANFSSPDCNNDGIPDECPAGGPLTLATYPLLPIDDNTSISSAIVVYPNAGNVQDVNVGLTIEHTWSGDLDITLSKATTTIHLTYGTGGGANYTGTVFDDQAATYIWDYPTADSPFTGTFRPSNPLGDFNGQPAGGAWTLTVTDQFGGDTGTLVSWSLLVTVPVADCNTDGVPDTCAFMLDCNYNSIPDECDVASGAVPDCNTNGVPDSCDRDQLLDIDCNTNGTLDLCDLVNGATDCDTNNALDLCELDCDTNGTKDVCDVALGGAADCNSNGFPDRCDVLGFINLAPRVGYQAGASPFGNPGTGTVVASDVDGDGDKDLVVSDGFSQDVSVLRNNGAGVFAAPDDYHVGPFIGELTVGDFDGVQGPDIAVLDGQNNRIQILLNTGAGAFTFGGTFAVGNGAQGLKSGDVNNDAKRDLVAGNNADHTVSVLRGNGDGTFQTQVVYPLADGATALDLADLNGDNRPDIAASFFSFSPSFAMLFNDGLGNFGVPSYVGGASTPYNIIAADMDGDGDRDIVTANFNGADVTLFTNDGAGNITLQTHFPTGGLPLGLAVGDLNGDGRPEIVSGEWGDVMITVLRNDGGGVFTKVLRTSVATYPTGVAIAPLNADAKPDIAVGNVNGPASTAVTVHMNTTQAALPDTNHNGVPDACETTMCATCKGDLTGDNRHDGADVNSFVTCLFNGPGIGVGCGCADMNGDNQIDATDIGLFSNALLSGSTACP